MACLWLFPVLCFGPYFFQHCHWCIGFSLGTPLLNVLFFWHLLSGCALSHREKALPAVSLSNSFKICNNLLKTIFALICQQSLAVTHIWYWILSWSFPCVSYYWILLSWVLRAVLLISAMLRWVALLQSQLNSQKVLKVILLSSLTPLGKKSLVYFLSISCWKTSCPSDFKTVGQCDICYITGRRKWQGMVSRLSRDF